MIFSHWRVGVFGLITLIVVILYAPIFSAGLINDDFIEIGARYFDAQDGLNKDDVGVWADRFVERSLIDPVTDRQIFRPWRQVIFAADYFVWGMMPIGYHLTNILLYILLCWVVVLLAWHLMRRPLEAAVAGVLFALYTVHATPVISISSRGHILAALFVGLCVLFYALPRTRLHFWASWVMCALAIGSKETAWTTPAILLAYEVLYRREEIRRDIPGLLRRQALFWVLPLAVIGLRVLTPGVGGGEAFSLGDWDWVYQIEGYTLFAVRPFLLDINEWQTALILGGGVALGIVYRARREVVFGLLWVLLAMPVTIFFPPTERYFATASMGLILALSSILAQPFAPTARWYQVGRYAGLAVAAVMVVVFGVGTWNRNNDYLDLSNVTRRTLAQLQASKPTLPNGAELTFVGLSAPARGGVLFLTARQLQYAVQLTYSDRSLHVEMADNFPTTLAVPDKSYFFEYANHQLTERADLVTALRGRRHCGDSPEKVIRWDFAADAQGWEPWSEIEGMQNSGGALEFQTAGTDGFLGSPFVRVRPQEIDKIEIEMRARAATPTFTAELYWQTGAMSDFSPDARTSFAVNADDVAHTYTIALDAAGNEPITRLRFDPADVPAEIQLESITIRCK